jgi:D-lactate dehydrogenase (cytochrome)
MPLPSFSLFSDAGNAVFPPADARFQTVRPESEAVLREILQKADEARTPVTCFAALTGLAGSAVPQESGLRIDLTGLDTVPDRVGWRRISPYLLISETDPHLGIVAPGISLQTLNAALDALDLWYPPHPGEVRATIGGNVATNASGPRTFAFGATREYVVSLRIVLANGDVLNVERGRTFASGRAFSVRGASGSQYAGRIPGYEMPRVKNAAGLFAAADMDLIDLFIGSEGILGVFTEIGLRFLPRRAIRSEIFFFDSTQEAFAFADALRPLKADAGRYPDRSESGDGILALEFFDSGSLALARDSEGGDGFQFSVPTSAGAAIEVETFADDPESRARILLLAERLHCVGTIPPELAGAFRYAVPRRVADILKQRGQPKFGTDFAVPRSAFSEMYAFHEEMDREFVNGADAGRSSARTAKWGHLGDSHLHCNFLCENAADVARAKAIYLKLVRKAVALGGTISAEHGVGKKTLADENGTVRPYLWYLLGDGFLQIADVKDVFDPNGILNRGNMGIRSGSRSNDSTPRG